MERNTDYVCGRAIGIIRCIAEQQNHGTAKLLFKEPPHMGGPKRRRMCAA